MLLIEITRIRKIEVPHAWSPHDPGIERQHPVIQSDPVLIKMKFRVKSWIKKLVGAVICPSFFELFLDYRKVWSDPLDQNAAFFCDPDPLEDPG